MDAPTPDPIEPAHAGGGPALVPALLLGAGLVGLSVIIYPSVWFTDQVALIGGQPFARTSWFATHALLAAAVLLPSLLAIAAVRTPGARAIFQTWALAGLFMVFVLPVQLAAASAAQVAAILQITGSIAFLACLWFIDQRAGKPRPSSGRSVPATLLAAALIVWPWVVWGALGSWLDTLLNLAAALLFGFAAGHVVCRYLFSATGDGEGAPKLPFFLVGIAVGVTLLVMGASYGHNGQQLILLFLMPALGWLAAAVASRRPGDDPGPHRRAVSLLVGLVAAAPLLFVDPEELALVLNLGSRDVAAYAFYSTILSVGIALILGLAAWALGRRESRQPRLTTFLATAAFVGLLIAYIFTGQPDLHGERLYVILAEQADLSAAADIDDPMDRRAFVYQSLVRHANITQADLRRALDAGLVSYRPYYLVNALEVDAGPLVRLWLESRPEVDRVLVSPELRPLPEPPPTTRGSAAPPTEPQWNLVNIGSPRVWESFDARGAGIVIGQSDSGVDGTHPELSDQYRGNRTDGPAGDDFNWLDPWYDTPAPTDRGGHGTHTLGSVLGRSVGVAPEATWIGCVNLARNLGNAPRYLDCLQFLLAPFPQSGDPLRDGRPELGAHVLNNSWGCPEIEGCDPTSLLPAARALRTAGVFVVASAGNDGAECSTVNAPISLYDEVFSVGAVDEFDVVAPFSSRGPVTADGSGRLKPDIVAPGVAVLSAFPDGTYEYSDGTSMAGPHVAGVVALLWSANPALIGEIDETERIITQTARPITHTTTMCDDEDSLPNNTTGYGLVDAFAAVMAAQTFEK